MRHFVRRIAMASGMPLMHSWIRTYSSVIVGTREVSDDSAPHVCGPSGRLRVWVAEEQCQRTTPRPVFCGRDRRPAGARGIATRQGRKRADEWHGDRHRPPRTPMKPHKARRRGIGRYGQTVIRTARKLGVQSELPAVPSLALVCENRQDTRGTSQDSEVAFPSCPARLNAREYFCTS